MSQTKMGGFETKMGGFADKSGWIHRQKWVDLFLEALLCAASKPLKDIK